MPGHGEMSRMLIAIHTAYRFGCGGERSRSCAAESRSTRCMAPPQTGQFQRECVFSVADDAGSAVCFSEPPSS